jgi:chromosome segregation ATPase
MEKTTQETKQIFNGYEFESKIYILHELRDELEKTIGNINEVLSQQEELKSIVQKELEHGKKSKHKWEDFVNGITQSNEEYQEQIKKLENKISHLNAILEAHAKQETDEQKDISKLVDVIVTYTLMAIGQ